ncbi:hypothetical protein HNR46_003193 [Haloferula luteola]|uniref:Uncharacterized protein n=1 Tax=Haloferula luteola TaxID=595692 RepID=A0A840V5N4_9BACT|nr:hypothetical protein [Haloferula luteola]MBB5352943.1 hypothetical protein [Haloferula luteola]
MKLTAFFGLIVLVCASELQASPLKGVSVSTAQLNRAVEWADYTGYDPEILGDTCFAHTWADLSGSTSGSGFAYTLEKHKPGAGMPSNPYAEDYVLELAMPMFPEVDNSGVSYALIGNRFSQGISGNFDSYWQTLAQNLVAMGLDDVHIRLGWEFNQDLGSVSWAVGGGTASQMQDFASYWQRIHGVMMGVAGADFKWSWSVLLGLEDLTEFATLTANAYPGDSYVDFISVDVYDSSGIAGYYKHIWQDLSQSWSDQLSEHEIRERTWEEIKSGVFRDTNSTGNIWFYGAGLDEYKNFADDHGKEFIISEAGIVEERRTIPSYNLNSGLKDGGTGGNDNPSFICRLYDWAENQDIYGVIYFEYAVCRYNTNHDAMPFVVDHALLPDYWQLGIDDNPIYPENTPHPRSSAALLKVLGDTTPLSDLVPSPRKYVGGLEIPYMGNDWLFQTTIGSNPVYFAFAPCVVKADVTASTGDWAGIAAMGTSSQSGYVFEGYCGASGMPSQSPVGGSFTGPVWRLLKNGTQVWTSEVIPVVSTIVENGGGWTTESEEMSMVITNEPSSGKRIKMIFGSDVVGEYSDSTSLTGSNGQTYNGQTSNGSRLPSESVKTSWFYQENFDDGDADGFTLGGWTPARTQLNASNTSGNKISNVGNVTDGDYTVALQVASNSNNKGYGVLFLNDSSGYHYEVMLVTEDRIDGSGYKKNMLKSIELKESGVSSATLDYVALSSDVYMGVLQDLRIRTKNVEVALETEIVNGEEVVTQWGDAVEIKVYLNNQLLIDFTDDSPVSLSGTSGVWAEQFTEVWVDNYIVLPSI